jgi:hypothetical protein
MKRQSKFTPELADEICLRLSNGETLRSICRDEGKPSWVSVYDWINKYPDFALRVAHARELGYDAITQECLEIADTPIEGLKTVTDSNGIRLERADMIHHRKLQIETRLKLLKIWNPAKYGDRLDVTSDNKELKAPIIQVVRPNDQD